MWTRKAKPAEERFPKDAEVGMVMAAPVVAYEPAPRTNIIRPSHDTTFTEATAVGANNDYGNGTLNKIEQRTDRTILPPVLDRPVSRNAVSRAESRVAPVEVPATYSAPAVVTPMHDYYPEANQAGYYTAPPVNPVHSDPAAVDITKAIFGHEDANTGRNF